MPHNIQLLIIDPQNDFCDPNGSLFVPGANEDMKRLAGLVTRLRDKLADISITLDSHRIVDISHPTWWKDSAGHAPAPFTIIGADDVRNGRWTTRQPSFLSRSLEYLEELERRGRYPHCIWPVHCLIGDEGHNVFPVLAAAVHDWERSRFAIPNFVTKGSNIWTEHFSAVMAEVPDPEDPATQLNTSLIHTLEEADTILLAGEALSHCLANTVTDISTHFSDPRYVQKMVLLTDASSNVTGFDHFGSDFLRNLTAKGMKTTTTQDFLA